MKDSGLSSVLLIPTYNELLIVCPLNKIMCHKKGILNIKVNKANNFKKHMREIANIK